MGVTEPIGRSPYAEGISLVAIANSLLRHRRLVASTMATFLVLMIAWTLVWPRTYTAKAWFMPQTDQSAVSGLAGVAAQFGISVPNAQAGQSPDFYVDLLTSHQLLSATVDTPYRFREGASTDSVSPIRQGTLVDLYKVRKGQPEPVRREVAIARLTKNVGALSDQRTGTVKLSVSTPWPLLSQQILIRMLDLVNAFNSEERRTQAQAQRRFVEGRLGDAKAELRQAEDRMQDFLQRNRDFRNSPQLTFEQGRLQRDLDVRQGVVATLTQSFEQSRIDEVRNTPVITVVQAAALPAIPDPRRLVLKCLIALVVGGMLGAGLALGRDLLSHSREQEPDEYATLLALREDTIRDARALWAITVGPVHLLRRRASGTKEVDR